MQSERQFDAPQSTGLDPHDSTLTQRMEGSRPCRVLVVDDDGLVRARLAALLRMSQFEVETAASGQEALTVMNAHHCHVLLTDWQMPDMDGLALSRMVRAKPSDGYVYVLMITVRDSKQDLLTGLAAGVDDYVAKSAPVEEFLARMEVARRITHVDYSLRTSNRENRRLAMTDALTGAKNLRYLMKNLPRELERSKRYGHSLAVLSCDIDRFKQINDAFGHEAGNDILRAFVARAQSCIRIASDWLARVGGDEFLIVLPETDAGGAKIVAQKLGQVFAQCPVSTHAGPVDFTASIGVTAIDARHGIKNTPSILDLLRAADRGLYASKRGAGNQATATAVTTAPARKLGKNKAS
jgi:two-component system cell cycle response regulator